MGTKKMPSSDKGSRWVSWLYIFSTKTENISGDAESEGLARQSRESRTAVSELAKRAEQLAPPHRQPGESTASKNH